MKVNPLLSEIIRGQWLMQPQYVAGMGSVVAKILAGEEVSFEGDSATLVTFYDKDRKVVPGEYLTGYWGRIMRADFNVPEGSYAVVDIMGAVVKYGTPCNWGANEITSVLNRVNNMANVKGIVENIDGPGGSVSAIGPFLEFAKKKRKPSVGLMDLAASLHYWIAVATCDHLMCDNNVSAMVGSVGVVSSFTDTRPYYEEMGIKFHEIYPPESKDKNLSFRLALEGKYDKIIEEHMSPLAKKFQGGVRAGRPNLIEADGVLTGKTFYADQALEYGMIDSVGSLDAAFEELDRLAFKQAVNSM